MGLVSGGTSSVMDLVTEHSHTFRSLSALVTGLFDRGEDRFRELSWYIDCAQGHRVILLLWQELVGGGGIGRSPNRALHGDGALLLVYWAHKPLRIGTVVSIMLAYGEINRTGLLGQMRRYGSHRGGLTNSVVDALTHMGFHMVQGGTCENF